MNHAVAHPRIYRKQAAIGVLEQNLFSGPTMTLFHKSALMFALLIASTAGYKLISALNSVNVEQIAAEAIPPPATASSEEPLPQAANATYKATPSAGEVPALSQEEQQRRMSLVLLGIPLPDGENLSHYYHDLRTRTANGDSEAAIKLARLAANCLPVWNEPAPLTSPADADEASKNNSAFEVCNELSPISREEISIQLDAAATAGNKQASIMALSFPPAKYLSNPQSEEARIWEQRAMARLELHAEAGDLDAIYELAQMYNFKSWNFRDTNRAQELAAEFVARSQAADPRRRIMGELHAGVNQ